METDNTTQNFFFAKRRLMRAFQEWCEATHNTETPINLFLFMVQKGLVDVDGVAEKLEPRREAVTDID